MEQERYYTMREAAMKLGLPLSTVRRQVREGAIPALHLGARVVRIPADWVDKAAELLKAAKEQNPPEQFVRSLYKKEVNE